LFLNGDTNWIRKLKHGKDIHQRASGSGCLPDGRLSILIAAAFEEQPFHWARLLAFADRAAASVFPGYVLHHLHVVPHTFSPNQKEAVNPLERPKTQLPVNFRPNYCSSLIEHHEIKSFQQQRSVKTFIRKIPARDGDDRKGQKKRTPSQLFILRWTDCSTLFLVSLHDQRRSTMINWPI
jgi:hypothetical protein